MFHCTSINNALSFKLALDSSTDLHRLYLKIPARSTLTLALVRLPAEIIFKIYHHLNEDTDAETWERYCNWRDTHRPDESDQDGFVMSDQHDADKT